MFLFLRPYSYRSAIEFLKFRGLCLSLWANKDYLLFLRSVSRGFIYRSTEHTCFTQNNSNKTILTKQACPTTRDQRERVASASQNHHAAKAIIYPVSKKPHLPFGLIIIRSRRDPNCPFGATITRLPEKSKLPQAKIYSFDETLSVSPDSISEFPRTPICLIETTKQKQGLFDITYRITAASIQHQNTMTLFRRLSWYFRTIFSEGRAQKP